MKSSHDKELILNYLRNGEIVVEGRFTWGSNFTFLCDVKRGEETIKAVYKPTQGERPLWDFPSETLAGREVAAYLVSEAGGWHMVPPTVYRADGQAGGGSLQFYVDHDPEYHYFNFTSEEKERLRPVVIFDEVINNTDRKGGHVVMDDEKHIWLIDHGVCFHEKSKLRTVVWDFANQQIPEDCLQQIRSFKEKLTPEQEVYQELVKHLSEIEIRAMIARIDKLVKTGIFPRPSGNRYSYPWPPV